MPRKKKTRKIVAPPQFEGFRPFGVNKKTKSPVELLFEEYEAIKLTDYDLMNHQEAAELMGISRATFARIYETARRKVATALVDTREIKAIHGDIYTENIWLLCSNCYTRFSIDKDIERQSCPICNSYELEVITKSRRS